MEHIIIAMKILFNPVIQTAPKSQKRRLVLVFQNLQNPNTPGKVNIFLSYKVNIRSRIRAWCVEECAASYWEGKVSITNNVCRQVGGGGGKKTVTALVGYHQEYVKQGQIQVFKNNFFWILRMWFKFNKLN